MMVRLPVPPSFEGVRHATSCGAVEPFAVERIEDAERGLTQSHRFFEHRVEHWREIARRSIDYAEYFGGRRLLLQGFARLGEKPPILQRESSRRGEILEKRYLLLRERPSLLAVAVYVAE